MAEDFVQSFSRLSSKQRSIALRKLVQAVDFDERQEVIAVATEKNDIVPALPVELILQVFSYLHVLDAWTLQLVGTRWRRVLSSEQFLRAALSRWDTHDPSDSVRSIEATSKSSTQSRIRHMRAIRLGRPFSVTVLYDTGTGLQGPQPQFSHRKLDLKGHRIAYMSSVPESGDTVVVRDLITGDASMLRGEARERILSVVLTDTLIGFVTFDGWLYVSEFSDHLFLRQTLCVRLPSSRIRGCGGHRGFIALAQHDNIYITNVLLYDATTRKLRSFDVQSSYKSLLGNARSLNSCNVLVDSHKRTIDIFTLAFDMGAAPGRSDGNKSLQIQLLRISFDGDVVCTNSWSHPLHFETSVREAHFTMIPPQPTGYQGQYRIQVGEIPLMGSFPIRFKFDVVFDAYRATFFRKPTEEMRLATIDETHSTLEPAFAERIRAQWKELAVNLTRSSDLWVEYLALINDTFLVSLEVNHDQTQRNRIRVFCFDENVHMHGSKSTGFWKND